MDLDKLDCNAYLTVQPQTAGYEPQIHAMVESLILPEEAGLLDGIGANSAALHGVRRCR